MDNTGLKIIVTADTDKFKKGISRASKDAGDTIKKELGEATEGLSKNTDDANESLKNMASSGMKAALSMGKLVAAMVIAKGIEVAVGAALIAIGGAIDLVKKNNQDVVNKFAYLQAIVQSIYRTLEPIATKIINWILNTIIKIAYWVDYIVQAWFGVSLLEHAGEEYEKNMKKAAQDAKEINKQLMGFDEANVLNGDNGNKDKGLTPTAFKVEPIDVPDWVKWIADHKDLIITLATVVGIAWAGAKVAGVLSSIASVASALIALLPYLALVITVVCAAQVWTEFQHLGEEIDRITEKQREYNRAWKESMDPKNAKDMAQIVETQRVNIQGAHDSLKKAHSVLGKIGGKAEHWAKSALAVVEESKTTVDKLWEEYNLTTTTKERKEEILSILEEIKAEQKDITLDASLWVDDTEKADDVYFHTWNIIDKIKDDLGIVREESNGIQETGIEWVDDMYRRMGLLKDKEEELQDPWNDLKTTALGVLDKIKDYKIGDKTFNLKAVMNADIAKKLVDSYDKITSGGGLGALSLQIFSPLVKQLRKMYSATGSIVNLPGHGVPVGNNVWAGEAGREGIIPLTDPHAMSELGAEIGRWVNISLQNNMVVDGQVLATATNDRISKERFLMNR